MPDDAKLNLSMPRWISLSVVAFALGCVQHVAETVPSGQVATIEIAELPSVSASASSPSSSSAPRVVKSTAPKTLGDDVIGCWQNHDAKEHWSLYRTPSGDIEVVRELDPKRPEYDRAKEPAAVRVDESLGVFGFQSAGPIHALMFACSKTSADAIQCGIYSSHAPGEEFHKTGNQIDLTRCP
jgi:hypothetical protein